MEDKKYTVIQLAESRFETFKEQVLDGKHLDTDEYGQKVAAYVENLITCCTENKLCNDSIASIFVAAFVDGFRIRDEVLRDGR